MELPSKEVDPHDGENEPEDQTHQQHVKDGWNRLHQSIHHHLEGGGFRGGGGLGVFWKNGGFGGKGWKSGSLGGGLGKIGVWGEGGGVRKLGVLAEGGGLGGGGRAWKSWEFGGGLVGVLGGVLEKGGLGRLKKNVFG